MWILVFGRLMQEDYGSESCLGLILTAVCRMSRYLKFVILILLILAKIIPNLSHI